MTHDTIKWLREAQRHGQRVLEWVEPIDYETYCSTEFPRLGVERYLISVGEAMRAALQMEPELATQIPNARDAIDLRNFLTHAYFYIDDQVVWDVATVRLAVLLGDIDRVIEARPSDI